VYILKISAFIQGVCYVNKLAVLANFRSYMIRNFINLHFLMQARNYFEIIQIFENVTLKGFGVKIMPRA